MAIVRDLSGKRFGRLVARAFVAQDRFKRKIWECRCDCGEVAVVASRHLVNGATNSCGCLVPAISRANGRRGAWKHSGERSHLYKPELPPEERANRRDGARLWREAVFARDGFRCVLCGRQGRLQAHHLHNYAADRERRFDISNGVTVCVRHHKEFHAARGGQRFPCTKEDFDSYQRRWYPHAVGTANVGTAA